MLKLHLGERIEIDSQRLYQRLLVTGICDIPMHGACIFQLQAPDLFKYELCSFPTSLFDNHMRMRIGDKAEMILVPASIGSVEVDS